MAKDYLCVGNMVYTSLNKKGETEYYARLDHKGVRYTIKNYTKAFGCLSIAETEYKIEYVISLLEHEGYYYFDKLKEEKEAKKQQRRDTLEAKQKFLFNALWLKEFNKIGDSTPSKATKETNYENHIRYLIGGMDIREISEDDIQAVYQSMADKGRAIDTQKKVKAIIDTVLNPFAKKRVIPYNPTEFAFFVKPDNEKNLPPLNTRLKLVDIPDYLELARKVYEAIPAVINGAYSNPIRAYFYMNLLTARRRSELWRLNKHTDFNNELVHIDAKRTKTKIDEIYQMPQEVLDLIHNYKNYEERNNPFLISDSTINRNWHKIKTHIGISEDEVFRSYDCRHLFMSIMASSEYYSRELVGACLSHHSGDGTSNDYYHSFPWGERKKVFIQYWRLVRGEEELKESE